jgi:hypothetical protein
MYTVYLCETVTGKNMGALECDVRSWTRELNGTDVATVVVPPGALTVATRDNIRLYSTPQRMTLVIEWSNPGDTVGIPVFSGPILTRSWADSLTLNAVGIRSIFNKRKALNWTLPYAAQVLSYTNMSLGSIAIALGQLVTNNATKPGSSLPINWPVPEVDADSTHTRNYYGYELKNVGDIWTDLTGVINGPDLDLQPVWADGSRSAINYNFRVGTDEQPQLFAAQQIVFDAAQPQSSVKSLTLLEDASLLTTQRWANGSGISGASLMSMATSSTLTSAGYPLLETEVDYATVIDQVTLDAHTAGDLVTFDTSTIQWGLTVDATLPPLFGSYATGDHARVRVANHLWIPDGDYPMRIVSMSGDNSTSVTLAIQGA